MTVSIISGIPIYAGPRDIVTSIVAPNYPGGGTIGIGDVLGLQASLDTKLDDVLTALGQTNVITTGAELNFLSGVTSNVQIQIDGKLNLTGGTLSGDLLFGALAQLLINPATAALPGLAFNGDTNTGIWWPLADTIGFATGGIDVLHILPSGLVQSQIANYETLVLADDDIPNKKYVDDAIALSSGGPFLPLAGGEMSGDIDLNGVAQIIFDADGNSLIEGTIDDVINIWLGGGVAFTFNTTTLSVGTKTITNVVDPVVAQDAATKNYVDTEITALALNDTGPYLRLSGADTMLGALNMGTNLINAIVDPVGAQDAATKNYVDTEITALTLGGTGPFLQLAGGTMAGAIDMGTTNKIINLANPTLAQDAVTLDYADNNYLLATGAIGPAGGDFDMGGNNITNLADPVNPQDAATFAWVDANYLDLAGTSAMTGSIDMGANVITNLAAATANDEAVTLGQANGLYFRLDGSSAMTADANIGGFKLTSVANPTLAQDAVTLSYADANYVRADGTTPLAADLDAGGNTITNLAAPVAASDAATKDYVDDEIAALNLDGTYVNTAGDTMTGDLIMGANVQFLADDGGSSAPGYAFDSSDSTGMFYDGTNLQWSLVANPALTITPSGGTNEVDVHGRKVTDVADPTLPNDAVTLGYLNSGFVRILDRTTGIDLLNTGTTALFTVPAGTMYIVTQIIVRATSYNPGAAPTNPQISIGSNAGFNDIVDDNTELDWGGISGAADQVVYLTPKDGASSPNAATVVSLQVDTAGAGTFVALEAEVIVLGIEV